MISLILKARFPRSVSISSFLLIILFAISSGVIGQSKYSVFERGNYVGLKDDQGTVIIEPVYDQLGWSKETIHLDGLLGFKEGQKWGLLDTGGKRITGAVYDKIYPLNSELIVVATKGKFTNRFFYGLIDANGRLKLSQDYFEIELDKQIILLTELKENEFLVGAVNPRLKKILDVAYESIEVLGNLVVGEKYNGHIDVVNHNGEILERELDEVKKLDEFLISTRYGFDGLISFDGNVVHKPVFKEITSPDEVIDFASWEIKGKEKKTEYRCDSLTEVSQDIWLVHLSNVVRFSSERRDITDEPTRFVESTNGYSVLRSIPEGKWRLFNEFGKKVLESDDSIRLEGKFAVVKTNSWRLFNLAGKTVSDKTFDEVRVLSDRFAAVRKFGYWALLDGILKELSDFRYDEIRSVHGSKAIVHFVNEWGVIQGDSWIIEPNYSDIEWVNDHFIARKNGSYFLFDDLGINKFQTIDQIIERDGLFLLRHEDQFSALNKWGRPLANTEYDIVNRWGAFTELRNGFASLVDQNGKWIFREEDQIQEVHGISEERILVKKNNSYGFTDLSGRLRIANRYESAKLFSEGLAAVKIRGKWGFVDGNERLVIQPHYDDVTLFKKGVAVYKLNGFYGLLNKKGQELTKASFKSLVRYKGGYLMLSKTGKYGLASENGVLLVNPSYDHIEQINNKWLVRLNGRYGLLDSNGKTILSPEYSRIQISNDNFLLRQ